MMDEGVELLLSMDEGTKPLLGIGAEGEVRPLSAKVVGLVSLLEKEEEKGFLLLTPLSAGFLLVFALFRVTPNGPRTLGSDSFSSLLAALFTAELGELSELGLLKGAEAKGLFPRLLRTRSSAEALLPTLPELGTDVAEDC